MDLSKQAEKWFGNARWRDIAAVFMTALVSLLIFDTLVVRSVDRRDTSLMPVADPDAPISKRWRRYDPRGFVDYDDLDIPADHFNLAWIVGSSITIWDAPAQFRFHGRKEYELSEVFAAQVKEINEKPLWIHQYMIPAMRSGDIRFAVLEAANDPEMDAYLMEINPAWLFNNWLVYSDSNQRGSVVAMKQATTGDFIDAIKFAHASDILAAYSSRAFAFVRDRYVLKDALPSVKGLPFPLLEKPKPTRKLRYLDLNKFYPDRTFIAPEATKAHESYRGVLLKQTLSENAQAARFFRRNLETLAKTGKPVLLYCPPLPPEMNDDPEVVAFMNDYGKLAQEMNERYGGNNVVIVTDSALDTRQPFKHRDIIHVRYGQGPIDEIKSMLVEDLGLSLTPFSEPDDYRSAP